MGYTAWGSLDIPLLYKPSKSRGDLRPAATGELFRDVWADAEEAFRAAFAGRELERQLAGF